MSQVQGNTVNTADQSGARELAQRLSAAREAGNWLGWVGIALGLLWIAAAILGAISFFGWEATTALSLQTSILAGMGIVIPALLLVTSGYMARANRRAGAANAIVMEAAAQLLSPAESATHATETLAAQMSNSAAGVDRSMAHALSAMKAMAGEIGDERQRLEQVSLATSDNARDLSARLSEERNSLEALARDLRGQMAEMNDAIPRQAEMMVSAARMAGEEVAKADEALDNKLAKMTEARDALSEKLMQLDKIAAEAAQRTEDVTFAVTRVEQKLDESRRTVEAAVRAGEMAAAGATATGDALKDAVSVALEGARAANLEIAQRTREASEMAARDLAALRLAAEQAASSVTSAGLAARAESDRIARGVPQQATPIPAARPEPALHQNAPPQPEPAHLNGHANGQETETDVPPGIAMPAVTPAHAPLSAEPSPKPDRPMDDELFDASADRLAGVQAPLELGREADPADATPLTLRQRFEDDASLDAGGQAPQINSLETPLSAPLAASGLRAPAQNDTAWREMLADIDRTDMPPRDREETATELIERLENSGIRLPEALRPKDKKRIANAARKGQSQRRGATLDAASRQVERVGSRLKTDRELMLLARDFIGMEEGDALVALEQTYKTNRNASSRLAAFLLLDAALNS